MTEREREILHLIRENPMISQEEIAKKIGITRTSVAVHISNIMKKGIILGKGYIINESPYIMVIGGTNVDIQGFSRSELRAHDSNPGYVGVSFGGVGKNIAENIARLDINTKFITVFGNDLYGEKIKDHLNKLDIDVSDSLILENEETSIYLSILDSNGEMNVAISSMEIFKKLKPEYLKARNKKIEGAEIIIVDTNLEKDTINYIMGYNAKTKIMLDTVSTKKSEKVKDIIGKFHTIKPNKIEAELLSGIKINSDSDLDRAGKFFLEAGIKNIFITLGSDGVYYINDKKKGIIKNPKVTPVNVTGGGDAFVAGIAHAEFMGKDIDEAAKFGIGASILTILDENTISDKISVENIENKIKEMKL